VTDFKTSDRDVNRAIRSWLREDRHEDASRLAGAVLTQVDTTTQRRALWWPARRTPIMNKVVGFGLAAAAVLVVGLLLGPQLLGSPTNLGTSGEPTLTPVPTGAAQRTPGGPLPEVSHTLWDRQGARVQITVTIPAPDWYGEPGDGTLQKDDHSDAPDGAGLFVFGGSTRLFSQDLYVYGDPCQWRTTRPDAPVSTLEEVVTALASQASRNASTPTDVTVDGHPGKLITLRVPDDAVFSDCDEGEFRTLIQVYEDGSGGEARSAQDPGQFEKLWILDVNGDLVIIGAGYYAETPQSVVDELDAIMESATLTSPDY
jgi:hypothetical protein